MRTIRNLSFLILCSAFILTAATPLRAECSAPGLVGHGTTEALAEQDCYEYALQHCESLCMEPETCSTTQWHGYSCQAIGSGETWSASGSCDCGPAA